MNAGKCAITLLFGTTLAQAATAPALPYAGTRAADGRIRVQLIARNAVTLSSEIAAKVATLPLQEGGSFRRGQALATFECSSYRAQLRKAQASLEAASRLVQINNQLAKLNSVGELEMAQSQGKAKEAAADTSYMQTVVRKCVISAPFNGRVARRIVAVHQFVNPGNPVIDVVDSGPLELRMLLPSKWIGRLKPGSRFSVAVDELGTSMSAKIVRIGAQVDPVSQSILAVGVIDDTAGKNLLPGMSGWASFK